MQFNRSAAQFDMVHEAQSIHQSDPERKLDGQSSSALPSAPITEAMMIQ